MASLNLISVRWVESSRVIYVESGTVIWVWAHSSRLRVLWPEISNSWLGFYAKLWVIYSLSGLNPSHHPQKFLLEKSSIVTMLKSYSVRTCKYLRWSNVARQNSPVFNFFGGDRSVGKIGRCQLIRAHTQSETYWSPVPSKTNVNHGNINKKHVRVCNLEEYSHAIVKKQRQLSTQICSRMIFFLRRTFYCNNMVFMQMRQDFQNLRLKKLSDFTFQWRKCNCLIWWALRNRER